MDYDVISSNIHGCSMDFGFVVRYMKWLPRLLVVG